MITLPIIIAFISGMISYIIYSIIIRRNKQSTIHIDRIKDNQFRQLIYMWEQDGTMCLAQKQIIDKAVGKTYLKCAKEFKSLLQWEKENEK